MGMVRGRFDAGFPSSAHWLYVSWPAPFQVTEVEAGRRVPQFAVRSGQRLRRPSMASKLASLIVGLALLSSSSAVAQGQRGELPQVAILNPFTPPEPGFQSFVERLKELGYVDGKQV